MQETQNHTALVYFTNNLRVRDNKALQQAVNLNKQVIALYCFDQRPFKITEYGFKKTEKFRAKFLMESIADLKEQLSKLNINLLTYNKIPETVVPKLVAKYQINRLYVQREWTQEEASVFNAIKKQIPKVKIFEFYDQFLYHPEDIKIDTKDLPKVFTDFRKHLEKTCEIREAISIPNSIENNIKTEITPNITLQDLEFEDFETHPSSAFPFKGGETNALKRLHDYFYETKKLGVYKKTRNGLIGPDFSSKFSPWLANGSLSAKTTYWEVKRFEALHFKNESTYWLIFELIWRDYFKYISLKHGNNIFKIDGILNIKYQWSESDILIKSWIEGTTNEPFVNANMLELKKTGWMSNRGRQNVASYFTKELHLDWRIGAAYFESMLIDYDVHSNYGNWMYVAGVGNDPRDRKFNVKLQAERYDANGKYQNMWLQNSLFE